MFVIITSLYHAINHTHKAIQIHISLLMLNAAILI